MCLAIFCAMNASSRDCGGQMAPMTRCVKVASMRVMSDVGVVVARPQRDARKRWFDSSTSFFCHDNV